MNVTDSLKKCKTVKEIQRVMNNYFANLNIKNKYSEILKISLKKQTDFNKALQLAFNYILNQEFPTKTNDTAYVRFKGTAISGLECHSRS